MNTSVFHFFYLALCFTAFLCCLLTPSIFHYSLPGGCLVYYIYIYIYILHININIYILINICIYILHIIYVLYILYNIYIYYLNPKSRQIQLKSSLIKTLFESKNVKNTVSLLTAACSHIQ